MVLNADELGVLLQRPLRGQVLRVEVVCDHLRLDPEHGEVQLHVGEEGPVGELGVEVAEVRRQEGLAFARDAERGLELGPGGEDRPRRGHREGQRARHVAARPPERERDTHDGVLAAAVDRPVVGEEGVGDARQALLGLGVLMGDWLVGAVSARQHERPSEVRGEEVVERRVGKHQAEPWDTGCDRRGHGRVRPAPDQDDGPLARTQQPFFLGPDVRQQLGPEGHERERLVLAVLAAAQQRDGLFVRCVAGEVIAAQALDCEDLAVA